MIFVSQLNHSRFPCAAKGLFSFYHPLILPMSQFYEQHSGEITACQAAKWYFDSLGLKKLPFMQSLKQEYAMLKAENRKRYPEYKQAKAKMIELLTAKNNVERILGVTEKEKNRDRQQGAR